MFFSRRATQGFFCSVNVIPLFFLPTKLFTYCCSSLAFQQSRQDHHPGVSLSTVMEPLSWTSWTNPSACPTQYTIYKTESSLTAQCVTTLALLEGRKCSHYITWHLHIFNKQRKSHLPFQEVDRVNNIPAILAQVLLKLLQDISNSSSIVQMNF